ncbi:MAG: hypothetical protein PF541_09350 [Prolixibacteraceae bacterium]|jgi:hypothetical protein|nr:hypothetical protein [Prolixibacteraceae bacterium]
MKTKHILIVLLLLIVITSCVTSVNVDACIDGKAYGFWHGLWHGIIAPIDLVAMIFNDKYAVYATNNSGAWYAFGFILGSGGWGFLGSKGRKKK